MPGDNVNAFKVRIDSEGTLRSEMMMVSSKIAKDPKDAVEMLFDPSNDRAVFLRAEGLNLVEFKNLVLQRIANEPGRQVNRDNS